MGYSHAIILGIVQGLGEFLPISSSAHLLLVPYIFGWAQHSDVFDVALHMGTLLALLVFFWRDFIRLIQAGLTKGTKTNDGKLFWFILLASVPGAVIGAVFESKIDSVLHNAITLIAIALALMGVVLWYVDKIAAKKRQMESITAVESFVIGCAQAVALLPGVSRSGATMTTGLLFGLTREAAARFSFYMSAPIIAGAGILKLRHLHSGDIDGPFLVGILVAGIVGYASIRFLLNYLRKGSYAVFAWYRILLAVIVLALVLVRHG